MKANELRIGNWINDNGYNSIIGVIDSHYHAIQISGSPRMIALETIEPIPITEEWLLKFGAKWDSDYVALEVNKLTIRTHLPNMKPASVFAYFDGIRIKQLKYVHELQNLYFALTGEELTIS